MTVYWFQQLLNKAENMNRRRIIFTRSVPCRGPICITKPNFIKIGQTVAEIWRFNGFFSKWRPSAILDLSGAYWDHPRRLHDWNHCSTFDNMKVLIFCVFGLKTPSHAAKIGFFGDLTPLVGSNINVTTKKH